MSRYHEPERDRPLLAAHASATHSSMVVSASLFVTALLGAGQALMIAFIVGEGDRTDAFLAGYALYVVFAIFGSSLRASVVPLIGSSSGATEESFRNGMEEVVSRILLVALMVFLGLIVIAPAAGQALTHGLPSDARWTAVVTLVVLAPAAFCQIEAAALAAALAAARRFVFSAVAYVVAGLIGLGLSALLLELVGVLGAPLGLLGGSLVLLAAHAIYLRSFGVHVRPRFEWLREKAQRDLLVTLVAGAAVAIAFQAQLAISLSAVSSEPGAITAYTYAFFLIALIISLSSPALGLVALPDLVARVAAEGKSAAERYLVGITPYAFAVLVPLLVLYAAYGKPLLEAVFADSLSTDTVSLIYELGLILEGMALPSALVYLVFSATFALERSRTFLWVAPVSIGIHALIVLPLSSLGPKAVAAGQGCSALATVVLLLVATYGREWAPTVLQALARSLPAFALSAVIVLLRLPLGSDPALGTTLAAALLAALAYGALVLVLWPSVGRGFRALLRRPGREGEEIAEDAVG